MSLGRSPLLARLTASMLVVAPLTSALSSVAHAQESDDRARAGELYQEAEELFRRELYLAAIEKFQQAHQLMAHPVNLYNIARAYEKLGDADNCVTSFNAYLDLYRRSNNGKDPSDFNDVNASITKCELLRRPEVSIESDPPGALIYIDDKNKLVGQTPFKTKLDPGKYKVFLELDGHVPFEQALEVRPGQPLRFNFKMERHQRVGKVRVTSNVRNASIFVDGRNIGLTPYSEAITVDAGRRQITVSKDEYTSFTREVEVGVNENITVNSELFLRDAPYTWKGYLAWPTLIIGAGLGVGGYLAGTEADKYFKGTKDFDQWSTLQTVGYAAGGTLVGVGILLLVLEATDSKITRDKDVLDPAANNKPLILPFVTSTGVVGADVRF